MDNLALNLLPIDDGKPKKKAVLPIAADTLVTPKGNIITRAQFDLSAKNGLPFTDMKAMGDWYDSWARPLPKDPVKSSPANAKAQAIIQPVVPTQIKKKDFYEGNGTPGSGGMRYHQ
jgi:hypothetical protein